MVKSHGEKSTANSMAIFFMKKPAAARIRDQTLSTTCAAWGPGAMESPYGFSQWEHCGDDDLLNLR